MVSGGQEFSQGTVGMAYLCSTVFGGPQLENPKADSSAHRRAHSLIDVAADAGCRLGAQLA